MKNWYSIDHQEWIFFFKLRVHFDDTGGSDIQQNLMEKKNKKY